MPVALVLDTGLWGSDMKDYAVTLLSVYPMKLNLIVLWLCLVASSGLCLIYCQLAHLIVVGVVTFSLLQAGTSAHASALCLAWYRLRLTFTA